MRQLRAARRSGLPGRYRALQTAGVKLLNIVVLTGKNSG